MSTRLVLNSMSDILSRRGLQTGGRTQQIIDSEVLRLCSPRVPHDKGVLERSGTLNTVLGSGKVVYNTPYARHWYYHSANFTGAPMRGSYWFERMKRQGGLEQIGAAIADSAGGRFNR